MPNKDKLSEALKNGLPQKSQVVTKETVQADPVNDEVKTELDDVTNKMSGTDPKQGIMPTAAAMKFIKELPLEVVVSNRSWRGNVGIKIDSNGNLTLSRNEDSEFNADNADRLVRNLLMNAFTSGREIKKWDVYLPELNQAMERSDKTLSNKRLKAALNNLAKAGPIEVLLNANKRGFAPNIIIGNKGKGSRSTTTELSADELVF